MTNRFYLFILNDDNESKMELEKLCTLLLENAVTGENSSEYSAPFGSLGPYGSKEEATRSREQMMESFNLDSSSHLKAWTLEQLRSARLVRIEIQATVKIED